MKIRFAIFALCVLVMGWRFPNEVAEAVRVLFPSTTQAPLGSITHWAGHVTLQTTSRERKQVSAREDVHSGDVLMVGAQGDARVFLEDGFLIDLGAYSEVELKLKSGRVRIEQRTGSARYRAALSLSSLMVSLQDTEMLLFDGDEVYVDAKQNRIVIVAQNRLRILKRGSVQISEWNKREPSSLSLDNESEALTIEDVAFEQRERVLGCLQRVSSKWKGDISVTLEVSGKSGKATSVEVSAPGPLQPQEAACIRYYLMTARFPRFKEPSVRVTVPFAIP